MNLTAAWIGFAFGSCAGAGLGLFFHRQDWLGGYGSWRRRMLRLGHISFFGIGLLNVAYAATAPAGTVWASRLLVAGAVGMPLACTLAAIDARWRHVFPLPAVCVIAATVMVAWRLILP